MLSKLTITSKTFVGLLLAVVMCVSVFAWQVTLKGSSPSIDAKPQIGAATPVTWTELPDIKNARFEASAVQYKGDVYAFNGFGQSIKVEPTVEKLNADTLTWSVINETSVADGNAVTHNGIVLNGKEVWIIGGRAGNHPGPVTSKVWKFNLDSRIWTAGPELPVPGAAGGAALVNNRIHWFGGLDTVAQCDVDNHFVYDLNNPTDGWRDISSIAPMPVPRNHFATAVLDGLIYAMGGQFTHDGCGPGTPDTELSHVFDPGTNTWDQIASLSAVQSHTEPSTFVHKGAIYMIGGATRGTTVFRYNPSKDHWDSIAQLPQPLLAPIARVINDELIVSSGGAPSITPSFITYKTDITPLLLPGAENSQNSDELSNSPKPNNSDSSSADIDPPDEVDSSSSDPVSDDQNSSNLDADGSNCDYSNAGASSGWGWDPIALVSCPPLTLVEPEYEAPQTPADIDPENIDSASNSTDQPIVLVVNPQPQTDESPTIKENSLTSSSGGGSVDKRLLLFLLIASGLIKERREKQRLRLDLPLRTRTHHVHRHIWTPHLCQAISHIKRCFAQQRLFTFDLSHSRLR